MLGDDGASRSTVRLLARWRGTGTRVVLFALRRPTGSAVELPPGVSPIHPAAVPLRLRSTLLRGLVRLVGLARGADVLVAAREIGWGLLVGRCAALCARRPFVVLVRSEPRAAIAHHVSPRWRALNRRAITSADRVVCISPGLVPAVEALGVDTRRIDVVLNGVEVDRVRAATARPALLLPRDGVPVVIGVGRLERQKGFDVLVQAHARVRESGVHHHLVVLGEGKERAALEALAAELGVSDTVHLPGFVADPLPEVAHADLFCLPSRWEGFGQTLAEALLLGTPTVAADCVSGPRLLLADGRHGDLVPVDDAAALASAIQRHLGDPDRLRRAAAHGQEWATTELDVGRTATQVLDVLRVAARPRRRT